MRTILSLITGFIMAFVICTPAITQEKKAGEWDPEVVELLEKASSHLEEDRKQREDSVKRLIEIGGPAVPYLCTRMNTDNVMERIALVNALQKIGEPAVEELHRALGREESEKAQRLVISILSRIGSEKSVPVFEEALGNPLWAFRASAAAGLGKVESDETTKLLIGLLDDSDDEVRLMGMLALGDRADDEIISRIIDMMDDPSCIVRFGAAEVAGDYGEAAVPLLEKKLDEDNRLVVKLLIIETLGNTKSLAAANVVEKYLANEEPLMRAYAATAFARTGPEDVKIKLESLLTSEESPIVKAAIEKALKNTD